MKLLFRLIIITAFLFSQTINEQLEELENASPKRRVELMNHIKQQLILMNEAKRMQTIRKMRAKLQPQNQNLNQQSMEIDESRYSVVENYTPVNNSYQDVQSYQEHLDEVVHRDIPTIPTNQPPMPQPTVPVIPTNQPPIAQPTVPVIPTNQPPMPQPTVPIIPTNQPPITQPTITQPNTPNREHEGLTNQFINGRR